MSFPAIKKATIQSRRPQICNAWLWKGPCLPRRSSSLNQLHTFLTSSLSLVQKQSECLSERINPITLFAFHIFWKQLRRGPSHGVYVALGPLKQLFWLKIYCPRCCAMEARLSLTEWNVWENAGSWAVQVLVGSHAVAAIGSVAFSISRIQDKPPDMKNF